MVQNVKNILRLDSKEAMDFCLKFVFDCVFSQKDTKYDTHNNSCISKNIQKYQRVFQQGRNIGIHQGSVIFVFLAEVIIGYSDLLFHESIQKEGVTTPYEIIRYRDGYRIFSSDKSVLEKISYILQHILESLNFCMNSKKTTISESIVTDSIKPDKLAYLYNTPISKKKSVHFESFKKYLLYILMFARQYPDCGSIKTMLSDIEKRIKDWLAKKEGQNSKLEDVDLGIKENIFSKVKTYNQSVSISGGSK